MAVFVDGPEEIPRRALELDMMDKMRMLGFLCRAKKRSTLWVRIAGTQHPRRALVPAADKLTRPRDARDKENPGKVVAQLGVNLPPPLT